VVFHDGTALTAAAVADSLTTGECAECPWTSLRAVGDSVVFEFADSRPNFAAELALPIYRIVRRSGGTMAGTGPFRYGDAAATVLQANENYWQGRPFLNTVEISTPAREHSGISADISELAPDQLRRRQQSSGRIAASAPVELVALVIRKQRTPLQDVRLRRALALSIDRAAIHNVLFQKQGEAAGGLLPKWISGYATLLPHERDLPQAQQLRREIANVPTLVIAAEDDPALQLTAERIALNARDAGIAVQGGRSDVADLIVVRRPLPVLNPAVALQQMAAIFDPRRANHPLETPQQWYETERDLAAQYDFVPIVYLPRFYAITPTVRNLQQEPNGRPRLQDVWLAAP
jgi:peptide/nickel transport system substrate-binding protein